MSNPECLQVKTGHCGGCQILNLAKDRVHRHGVQTDLDQIKSGAQKVELRYCPEPGRMQINLLKPLKRSIW